MPTNHFEMTKEIQIIKNKEKIGNTLFYIGIVLEMLVMMTDACSSYTIPYRGRITHVAFALFGCKILFTKYRAKEMANWIVVGIIGAISYYTCRDEYVIRLVMILAASKNIDWKTVFKIALYGSLAGSAVIIILSLAGVCGQAVDIRHYGRGLEEARYCLGFSHANNVHDMYWYCIVLFTLLKKKVSWRDIIILSVLNLFLYMLTLSRTGLIVAQIVLVGFALEKIVDWGKLPVLLEHLNYLLLGVCVSLTIITSRMLAVDNTILSICDRFLNGRLELASERTQYVYWRWFSPERPSPVVDNGYALVAFYYGEAILLLMMVLIVLLAIRFRIQNNVAGLIILLSTVLVIFMESTFVINVSLLCNMLILLFFCSVYNQSPLESE